MRDLCGDVDNETRDGLMDRHEEVGEKEKLVDSQ